MTNINLKTPQQQSKALSTPESSSAGFQNGSTSKQQDDYQPDSWELAIGQALVESSKRMEHDPEYRKEIQRRTR